MRRIGLVGARGHTGAELIRLIEAHPSFELAFVGSRSEAGRRVEEVVKGATSSLTFEAIDPGRLAHHVAEGRVEAVVLALPNRVGAPYVQAVDRAALLPCAVVDLSADHRFDADWTYGLVERHEAAIRSAGRGARIANPGCYATAAQLALGPIVGAAAAEAPRIFGVSGYSGAGTTPSPRNDPAQLRDNLVPYQSVGHLHEREIGHHLGAPVHFMPHVAAFFRGLSLTIDVVLREASTRDEVEARYVEAYADAPLVRVQAEIPLVREAAHHHHATVGGFAVDGRRVVVHATLDNLLKGAATQALQNLNLALGFEANTGIPH